MAENNVYVQLTVDEKKALASITKFTKSMEQSTKKIESRFDKLSGKFDSFVGNLGAQVVSKAVGAFTQTMSAAVDSAIDFEVAVTEINTLLPKTGKLTDSLKDDLIALSSQFGRSKAEQARAFYQIISSGAATGAEAIELLAGANTLATAGIADLGDSVNVITDIINVYGAENISAAEASDILFQTVKLGKTNIQELSTSIGQVLPAASRLGIGLDEVGASLATLTTQGLSTSQRVTQLNALFTALFKKGGDAGKLFGEKVGKAFSLTALRTKGLEKFLQDLIEATGGNEEVLVKLLGRTEAAQAVFGLTGKAAESLAGNLKSMASAAGAATTAAKENADTFSAQWDKAITKASNKIGKFLTPALNDAKLVLKAFTEETKKDSFDVLKNITDKLDEQKGKEEKLLNLQKAKGKLNSGELFRLKQIQEKVKELQGEYDSFTQSINKSAQQAEAARKKALGQDTEETKPTAQPKLTDIQKKQNALILEISAARIAKEQELEGLAQQARIAGANEDLEFRTQIFAREKELRVLNEQEKLAEKQLSEEQLAQLDMKFKGDQLQREIQLAKEKDKFEKEQADKKKKRLDQIAAFEKQNAQLSVNLAQNTANLVNAIAGKETKAGFLLSQAAAAAQVLLADSQARAAAMAAAATAGIATAGTATAPVFAKLQGLITANTAIALGTIAAQTLGGLADGGVIGGFGGATSGGDNMLQPVRTGEMVLNAQQQEELFNSIQGGSMGGDVVVQIDGREIARAVRDQKQQGFFI